MAKLLIIYHDDEITEVSHYNVKGLEYGTLLNRLEESVETLCEAEFRSRSSDKSQEPEQRRTWLNKVMNILALPLSSRSDA